MRCHLCIHRKVCKHFDEVNTLLNLLETEIKDSTINKSENLTFTADYHVTCKNCDKEDFSSNAKKVERSY